MASWLYVTCVVSLMSSCAVASSVYSPSWRADYPLSDDIKSGLTGIGAYTGCAMLDSNITRTGNYSIQHRLDKSDPDRAGSKRCESDSMGMKGSRIKRGKTQYYGFSVYLPRTWEFDNKPLADILFQWKGFRGGPFMMLVQKHRGLYLRAPGRQQFEVTRSVELGKWYDIRMMVHWEVNESGSIALDYKTSETTSYSRVVNYTGASMDRDAGGYLKWGIYKPVWKTNPVASAISNRSVWHDNIAIGDSWESVDPSKPEARRLEAQGGSEKPESLPSSTPPVQAGGTAGILLL